MDSSEAMSCYYIMLLTGLEVALATAVKFYKGVEGSYFLKLYSNARQTNLEVFSVVNVSSR